MRQEDREVYRVEIGEGCTETAREAPGPSKAIVSGGARFASNRDGRHNQVTEVVLDSLAESQVDSQEDIQGVETDPTIQK